MLAVVVKHVSHVGFTPLVLMAGLSFARKLVLWPYLSYMVCKGIWRSNPTIKYNDNVVDKSWI